MLVISLLFLHRVALRNVSETGRKQAEARAANITGRYLVTVLGFVVSFRVARLECVLRWDRPIAPKSSSERSEVGIAMQSGKDATWLSLGAR